MEETGAVVGTVAGVPVPKALNLEPNTVCYEFDLSAYKDTVGELTVRFVLDTPGGVSFVYDVASMRNGPNGGGYYGATRGMTGAPNLTLANG